MEGVPYRAGPSYARIGFVRAELELSVWARLRSGEWLRGVKEVKDWARRKGQRARWFEEAVVRSGRAGGPCYCRNADVLRLDYFFSLAL